MLKTQYLLKSLKVKKSRHFSLNTSIRFIHIYTNYIDFIYTIIESINYKLKLFLEIIKKVLIYNCKFFFKKKEIRISRNQ